MSKTVDPYPKIILSGTDPDLPENLPVGYAKYTDFREMARGGKAVLFSCWDTLMGRTIALKKMLPEIRQDERERRRFLREARVTAQLQHPNTVPVYEIGRDNEDSLYFTMKKIAGENLFKILQRLSWGDPTTEKQYPLDVRLEFIIQTCHALFYAHRHGVIHRDVKPENIWVGEFGEVVLLDWGVSKVWGTPSDSFNSQFAETDLIATEEEVEPPSESVEPVDLPQNELVTSTKDAQLLTLTQSGQRPGTPLYMSPEQILGNRYIDERTDIFSVGVLMYEMLTFREPFRGENVHETFDKIIHDLPRRPSGIAPNRQIPESLDRIVLKAISKKPEDRFEHMHAMIEQLRLARIDVLRGSAAAE